VDHDLPFRDENTSVESTKRDTRRLSTDGDYGNSNAQRRQPSVIAILRAVEDGTIRFVV